MICILVTFAQPSCWRIWNCHSPRLKYTTASTIFLWKGKTSFIWDGLVFWVEEMNTQYSQNKCFFCQAIYLPLSYFLKFRYPSHLFHVCIDKKINLKSLYIPLLSNKECATQKACHFFSKYFSSNCWKNNNLSFCIWFMHLVKKLNCSDSFRVAL